MTQNTALVRVRLCGLFLNLEHTVSRIDIILYFRHMHQFCMTFPICDALRLKLISCLDRSTYINFVWLFQFVTHCVSNWYLAWIEVHTSILLVFQLVTHCVTNWVGHINSSSCGWQSDRWLFQFIMHCVSNWTEGMMKTDSRRQGHRMIRKMYWFILLFYSYYNILNKYALIHIIR